MKKINLGLMLVAATLATACGKQPPAPVVSGFSAERTMSASIYTPGTDQEESYSPEGKQTLYHVVKRGDNLWEISQQYDTTTRNIMKLNNLESSMLRVGQRLKVKQSRDEAAKSIASDTGGSFTDRIARKEETGAERAQQSNRSTSRKTEPRETKAPSEAPAQPVEEQLHRVRKGENLFRIGLKYNVSPLDIMAVNDIEKPENLQAGSVITVPVVAESGKASGTREERAVNEELARKRGFIWPAKGKILSKFGRESDGVVNNGIKIKLPTNADIHAAEEGKVIYADDGLKTYGNLILLRHDNGLITAYAHASARLVNKGERVKKGEVIARVGQSGNVGEPQLHFEVRRNARAIDPLKILPNG